MMVRWWRAFPPNWSLAGGRFPEWGVPCWRAFPEFGQRLALCPRIGPPNAPCMATKMPQFLIRRVCPSSPEFCPRSPEFCPRSPEFCPRSPEFCPSSTELPEFARILPEFARILPEFPRIVRVRPNCPSSPELPEFARFSRLLPEFQAHFPECSPSFTGFLQAPSLPEFARMPLTFRMPLFSPKRRNATGLPGQRVWGLGLLLFGFWGGGSGGGLSWGFLLGGGGICFVGGAGCAGRGGLVAHVAGIPSLVISHWGVIAGSFHIEHASCKGFCMASHRRIHICLHHVCTLLYHVSPHSSVLGLFWTNKPHGEE